MVTSRDCVNKYGTPDIHMERKHMVLWSVPDEFTNAMPALPNRIYCNKDLVVPLRDAFINIIERDRACEIETWDGCFNIRRKRGYRSWSLHSWAIAVDINAARNGLGKEPQMSWELVKCFTDSGFDWGGNWTRKDGMHFQLANI